MKWFPVLIISITITHAADATVYDRFEQNGKVGIKDEQGHIIVPASFDALGWSDGSFSLIGEITGYRQGNHWGLLNLKKEFITKASYQSLTYPGGSRVLISHQVHVIAAKFGCIDLAGKLTIPMVYDEIRIDNLRAIVMQKHGSRYEYGLIDLNNRSILPVVYKQITPLGTLRYAVQDFSNKTALCSEDGAWSTGFDIDSISTFQHDFAVVYKDLRQGVIDRTGTIRLEPVYREINIQPMASTQPPNGEPPALILTRNPDVWKIIDMQQRVLHGIEADEVESAGSTFSRVTLGKRMGLVDSLFHPVLPLEFDYAGTVVNGKVIVRKNGKYGLLRTNQSEVLSVSFDTLVQHGHLIRAGRREGDKIWWDLYDTVGVRKTSASYERMGPYNGRFFPVALHGFAGGVDRTGKEQIACVYDSLLEVNDAYCVVKFRGQYGIITLDDRWKLTPQHFPLRLFAEDRYIERQDSLQIIKDFAGQIIYFSEYVLTVFPDHIIEQLPDGTEKEINIQGQIIQRTPAANHSPTEQQAQEHEGLRAIERDGKYGFVDTRGRLRIANRYEAVGNFHEGLARFQLLGKWGFIDKSDQIVVQPTFDMVTDFQNGIARVIRNKKQGLIDHQNTVLLELRYDSVRLMSDGSYLLSNDGLMGLADARGRVLIETRFESLTLAGPEHVIVMQSGHYGLLTRDGLSVFPLQYDRLVYRPETGTFFAVQRFPWETKELN